MLLAFPDLLWLDSFERILYREELQDLRQSTTENIEFFSFIKMGSGGTTLEKRKISGGKAIVFSLPHRCLHYVTIHTSSGGLLIASVFFILTIYMGRSAYRKGDENMYSCEFLPFERGSEREPMADNKFLCFFNIYFYS